MVSRFLERPSIRLTSLLLALSGSFGCATLEEVTPGCGNHVVEDNEDCDRAGGEPLCGQQDSPHQCRFVWDDSHDCPAGYAASPDKRCRKGSGDLAFSAIVETPGRDPQIADFGGDGTVELGMTELEPAVLALYTVNASAAERFAALPSFGSIALGELSGDGATDIVGPTESGVIASCGPSAGGTEPAGGTTTNAGLSVLRSSAEAFSLKVYANSTYGEAVRFAALPSWLFGGCQVFDLEVLTRLAVVGDNLEICAVDDCDGTKTTIAGVDSETKVDIDSNDAYAIASARGQADLLYIARQGFTNLGDAFGSPVMLTMPSGVTVESGVALVDLDGDGIDELVTLGHEPGNLFALYFLPGKAPVDMEVFPTLDGNTLQRWLEIPGWLPGDGGSSAFETADFNGDTIPDFFLGDRVLISTGVPFGAPLEPLDTYYRWECLVEQDFSGPVPTCKTHVPGAVGDVNGDGLDDLVAGLGVGTNQTIQLLSGGDSLPLVRVALQSDALGPGFLSTVAVTDFDGDGAADVLGSFRPTQDGVPVAPSEPCGAAESLVLAYGKVGSFPEPPAAIAGLPAVRQISAGKFRQPADGFGDFAVAVTCGSSATLFGDPFRRISSPFLFDDEDTSDFEPASVLLRDVVTTVDDALDDEEKPIPHPDLIVSGGQSVMDAQAGPRALLLPSWGDAELGLAKKLELEVPARLKDAASAPLAFGVEAQHGVVALAGVVQVSDDGGGSTVNIEGDWAISLIADGGEIETIALPFPASLAVELSELELLDSNAGFARAASADLNADGTPDFALVYGAPVIVSETTVGGEDPSGVRSARLASAVVLALSDGDGYVAKAVTGFELGFDAPVDLVLLGGRLLAISELSVYTVDANAGSAVWTAPLGIDAFVSEAIVADFSGDGLEDVMVFDGARGYLLEQLPLNP